jgi:hypothetical protein
MDPSLYALTIFHQATVNPDTIHLDLQLPASVSLVPTPGLKYDGGHLTGELPLTQQLHITNAASKK